MLSFTLLPDTYSISVAPILFLLSTSHIVFPNVSNSASSYWYKLLPPQNRWKYLANLSAAASIQSILPTEHFYSQKMDDVSAFLSLSLMRYSGNRGYHFLGLA